MKKCPFCAEDIQDAAIVCKHCHRDLPEVGSMVGEQRAEPVASGGPSLARPDVTKPKPFRPWIRGIRNSTENGIMSVTLALALLSTVASTKARGFEFIAEVALGTALSGALFGAICIGIYRLFGGGRQA